MSNLINIVLPAAQLEGTSATLSQWLVSVGSSVKSGDPIIELETDKVSMEICSPADGVLQEIIANEGDEVEVDSILGRLVQSDSLAKDAAAVALTAAPSAPPTSSAKAHQEEAHSANIQTPSVVDIVLSAEQLEGTLATLSQWLVSVGSSVKSGDPIIELETDKVSMEVCSPADGVLQEILANEGDEVAVDSILGRLVTNGAELDAKDAENVTKSKHEAATALSNTSADAANTSGLSQATQATQATTGATNTDGRALIGPAVRRLLREHNLDIGLILGSGRRGRVTRDDVRRYLANPPASKPIEAAANAPMPQKHPYALLERQPRPLQGTQIPHTKMRKAIANHMVKSLLHTSPHVTSVFEMDMSNIIAHRKWHKKEFADMGVNLTFTAYFLAASATAIKTVPQVNARFHEDALELFSDVNIGVGTALGDDGLVVPVVQQVQEMNLLEIAHALTGQTEKARNAKLTQADMKNGTFTISNHGVSGSLFAAPIIINQPQVAILGIGKLDKRVVVEEVNGIDTMVIKPMCYVSLSIDHRALDAHQTNTFLRAFVETIQQWGQ